MLLEKQGLEKRATRGESSQHTTSVEVILNEELLCLSHVYSVLI